MEEEGCYEKRRIRITAFLIVVVFTISGIMGGCFFIPNTPQKAVRLTILKNGHPIIALTETPKKVPGGSVYGYSGKRAWQYYKVKTAFDASNGEININTLAVNKPKAGSNFYRLHVVYPVA
ncbi:hypothetical protein [Levilactobacillus brevis]|uniref:hypothetical protein n=1 Tax=Levilactobacillus brevis TaxID=1580 RepID=UPI001F1A995B|nr:hypothetical protein [Levilactobacillus brevis]MCE6013987.1 hypothetical protein [Levilactobacillus brevis]MCE6016370.1 hypothetical protein [Levilactobacillus brevis]MCE6018777.1 hypothetical protein [Levilactobacillus brevis]MCE6021222.1 hypothetical protein [Levilactobacillus brevis]MCE6023678.1 hypothetical protein [Levilactobacillus brevis]